MEVIIVAFIGAVFGSFVGVAVDRFHPKYNGEQWLEQIVFSRSFCPQCKHTLRCRDLIPLLSWLRLRGHCRDCNTPIPYAIPAREALYALLFIVVYWCVPDTTQRLWLIFFSACLFTLSELDYRYLLLPDSLTLPLLWAGLIYNLQRAPLYSKYALAGAISGYLSLRLIAWLYRHYRHREGLGFGDIKLFAALGAWCGINALPFIIMLAALAGLTGHLYMMAKISSDEKNLRQPFGPALSAAGWLVFIIQLSGGENSIFYFV